MSLFDTNFIVVHSELYVLYTNYVAYVNLSTAACYTGTAAVGLHVASCWLCYETVGLLRYELTLICVGV